MCIEQNYMEPLAWVVAMSFLKVMHPGGGMQLVAGPLVSSNLSLYFFPVEPAAALVLGFRLKAADLMK